MAAKRILFVVHARYPVGEPRVQRQAVAALAAGCAVHVVSLCNEGEASEEEVEGIRVHRLPVHHDRSAGLAKMALEYLRFAVLATIRVARLHRRHRFDVVHVSNPPDLLVVAGLVPKLGGARLILDVHDLTPELFAWRFAGRRAERPIAWALRAQEWVACRLADHVITVHEACARVLRERGVGDGRDITIVMNTLDERLLPPPSDRPRLAGSEPVRIVYHGSLTELYGVHTLIAAVDHPELRDRVTLDVIGHGDALEALREQTARLGLEDVVSFTGRYVPISEALARVVDCDIGVVPLTGQPINRFSLPSKLFEYVTIGLPVVCSRTENIAGHFAEDEVAFFTPSDADELAQRLIETIEDPQVALRRAERARARCEAYRWAVNRERLLTGLGLADAR